MIECIDDKKADIGSFSDTLECRKHIQASPDISIENDDYPSLFSADYRLLLSINDCFHTIRNNLNFETSSCEKLPDTVIKNLQNYRNYNNKDMESVKVQLIEEMKAIKGENKAL